MKTLKKLIASAITISLCCTLMACGNNNTENKDDDNDSASNSAVNTTDKAEDNSPEAQFIGRWEKGGFCNSDDPSFEEYYDIKLLKDGGYRFIDFYSNGTGRTNYFVGNYCLGDSCAFRWKYTYDDFYDKEVIAITYAVTDDESPSGYKVSGSTILEPTPKTTYILGEIGDECVDYTEKTETVGLTFFSSHEPYVKVDSKEFVDNPDLGCEDAFAEIDAAFYEEE